MFRCNYDSRSLVELDDRPIVVSKLVTGDPLEILADRKPGTRACYARIVEVVDAVRERVKAQAARDRARTQQIVNSPLGFTPTGDRTLAGVVLRRDASTLTLRTRTGDVVLVLRPDTVYLDDGVRMNAGACNVNLHVSVRAGKDLEGEIEAYRVMWGEVLDVP